MGTLTTTLGRDAAVGGAARPLAGPTTCRWIAWPAKRVVSTCADPSSAFGAHDSARWRPEGPSQ